MKFLEAKQLKGPSSNKMLGGPSANKGDSDPATTPEPVTIRADILALADELGIDVHTVTGTGKGGTITKADIRKAAQMRDDPSGT